MHACSHSTTLHKRIYIYGMMTYALYLTCAWGQDQERSCIVVSPACTRRGSPPVPYSIDLAVRAHLYSYKTAHTMKTTHARCHETRALLFSVVSPAQTVMDFTPMEERICGACKILAIGVGSTRFRIPPALSSVLAALGTLRAGGILNRVDPRLTDT